jgi:hypothetical protein
MRLVVAVVAVLVLFESRPARAQQTTPPEEPFASSEAARPPAPAIDLVPDAPPEPVEPETISRDAEGRATVRAVRALQPLRIDGRLDDAHYTDVMPMAGFVQIEPVYDTAATDQTDIWVAFDDDNLYVAARMWDEDLTTLVATEMRRDSDTMFQGNDIISFIFDTFYDRRNGVMFSVNPIGGRSDTQVTGERQFNRDWNPVWDVKTARFDRGWTMEMAIPFKSLRYRPGRAQVWGFNVMRTKRSKNEMSVLVRVPLGRNQAALTQTAYAASLVGLETPPSGRNLDVKPYVTSSLTTNRMASPPVLNDPHAEAGLDLKYGVTQGLTADITVNTDFAQVEADEQQVNLTRFTLFFPEKREFFLENQGTFAFGGVQAGGGFQNQNQNNSAAPILFYSRRIGLNQGREVPLLAGGRMTGRVGRYTLGVLNAQTDNEEEELPLAAEATNFSVVRLRRDILRRSAIGVMATGRSVALSGVGSNVAYGADGQFLFFENLAINTYWARTETEGRSGSDISYRAELNQNGDRYGLQLERLVVGEDFNPELGFLARTNFRRSFAQARFSPRPRRFPSVRRFRYQAGINYVESGEGRLETREQDGEFVTEFQNSDQFNVRFLDSYEYLSRPFQIATGIVLPVGPYNFQTLRVGFSLGRQRKVSANMSVEYGTFYDGDKRTLNISQGRLSLTSAFSIEPTYSFNDVDLVEGDFTTHLIGSRITYTMSPLMFVSALVQYNSSINAVSTNARLRWEYRPGSELFVVYNEERNTLTTGFPTASTRSFVVKINRLFRP